MQIIRSGNLKAMLTLLAMALMISGCQQTAKQKADAQAKSEAKAEAKQEQQQAKAEKEQAKKDAELAKKEEKKAHDDMLKQSDTWWPTEGGSWAQFAKAQAAAGAQADASLSSEHFTGGKLNTLGQAKLQMMMQGGVQPAVVYLGALDDATVNVRRAAIDNWLKESGSGTDALVVKSGYNPRSSTPAMEGISRLKRTESTGEQRGPDQTSTAGQTGTSTGSGSSSQ